MGSAIAGLAMASAGFVYIIVLFVRA